MGTSYLNDSIEHMPLNGNGSATLELLAKRISRNMIKHEPLSSNYIVGDVLGRGKFAVVKKVTHRVSGQVLAAKFIRRRRKGVDCLEEILQEIAMLELARAHRRLIGMIEAYETLHEVIVVTEYAAGGELFQLCGGLDSQFTEQDAANIVYQILEGLQFLHCHNIVHLDIKPQNILLTEKYPQGEVRVCDFTSSRIVGANDEIKLIFGTPDYVAPEVLQYEPVGTATDIWSLGVVVYVLLTGHSPFASDDKQETFLNITEVNVTFPDELFASVSDSAQNFIRSCLSRHPSDRPTAVELLNHPWLRGQRSAVATAQLEAVSDQASRLCGDRSGASIASADDTMDRPVTASRSSASSVAATPQDVMSAVCTSPQKRQRCYDGGLVGSNGTTVCSLDHDNNSADSSGGTLGAAVSLTAQVVAAAELVCN